MGNRRLPHPQAKKGPAPNQNGPNLLKYRNEGYILFRDPQGYPPLTPPWGTLNAIDLNKGEIKWQIPFGEYPELVAKGMKDTGSDNYGGPVVTSSGLLFIGATSFDQKFRSAYVVTAHNHDLERRRARHHLASTVRCFCRMLTAGVVGPDGNVDASMPMLESELCLSDRHATIKVLSSPHSFNVPFRFRHQQRCEEVASSDGLTISPDMAPRCTQQRWPVITSRHRALVFPTLDVAGGPDGMG